MNAVTKHESDYQWRDRLVRNLQPHQAGALLVHSHIISPERRKALLLVRGPASAYFEPEEQKAIRDWMAAEDYLPQDSDLEHPKRPTHWCNYCGQTEGCEHDQRKERIEDLRRDLERSQAEVVRLKDEIRKMKSDLSEACRLVAHDHRND